MLIVREGEPLPDAPGVVTVGTFDGVHLGHQALLAATRAIADDLGLAAKVALFDRHPATVVRPESAPRLLTDLRQRFELLERAGVDVAYVVRFDEERSLQPPDQFVRDVVVATLGAKAYVVGEDHHFGHRRRGDVAVIAELATEHQMKVVGIPLVTVDGGGVVSSTTVRDALRAGDVALAARLLGRPHELRGIVEHGDKRGRTIGFPTANVAVAGDMMLPADGVYAGWYVRPSGEAMPAAVNVGRRPTFYDENGLLLVEAHLLDFDGDLYGERARVRFAARLRDEVRFDGIDALAAQLRLDVAAARVALR